MDVQNSRGLPTGIAALAVVLEDLLSLLLPLVTFEIGFVEFSNHTSSIPKTPSRRRGSELVLNHHSTAVEEPVASAAASAGASS